MRLRHHCLLLTLGLFAALSLTACAGFQRIETDTRHAKDIRELVDRFLDSVNAADVDRFVEFFADDAIAFFPTNAAGRQGKSAIRAAVAPAFAQGPRSTPAQANELRIFFEDELAIAHFDAGSSRQHARRTLVLRRIEGEWRIVHLHASNVSE